MLELFFIESKRQWLIFRRYPVEAFAGVVVFTIIFVGLFAGSRYLAGHASFGDRLDTVVASYVLWLVTIGLFASPGSQLTQDARMGILEQLFISPINFVSFTILRIFSGLLQHLLLICVVLVIICLITHSHLDYHVAELLPFAGVVLAAAGLGLMIAAYALVVKQVGAILGIGQFLLLGLVMTPVPAFGPWGRWVSALIPINPSAQLLQAELARNYAPSMQEVVLALGNGVVYFLLGAYLLGLASRRAQMQASIGMF